jgi:hypothetical protein
LIGNMTILSSSLTSSSLSLYLSLSLPLSPTKIWNDIYASLVHLDTASQKSLRKLSMKMRKKIEDVWGDKLLNKRS